MHTTSHKPDFFIVGAPKSGTSALFAHLGQHPQVFVCPVKEPLFFGSDLEYLNCGRRTLDEYLALFADAGDALRIGEASTTYLYSRLAPVEIRDFNPDARIIIMLRDPVAVMHAWHGENVANGGEPIRSFSAALDAEERRHAGRDLPNRRTVREGLYYREIVDFAHHVARYLEVFGRERVHVILFDDWVASSSSVCTQTLEFLQVDPPLVGDLGVVNPSKCIRSHRLHDLVAEPPVALQRAARAVLPPRIRQGLRHELLRLNRYAAPRDPMDPALVAQLRMELAPGIERLAALIDRDLSAWTAEAADRHEDPVVPEGDDAASARAPGPGPGAGPHSGSARPSRIALR